MAEKHKPVIFEDSAGNIISNDPIYLAQKTLEAAGVSFENSQPNELADAAKQAAKTEETPAETVEESLDDDGNRDYDELDGKGLMSLASERGVDITGLKKVAQVREALIADDTAKRTAAAAE